VPYLIGGFDMLDRCLEENFGVHVDHNIEVDFSGFKAVIDAMGGIDIELTEQEAKIVEGDQVVGMNHLDGGQALMYARIRKIDNDFERTNRQRKVLTVLFEKIRSMNLLGLLRVSKEVLPMLTTDMTDEEILEYVLEFAPILNELEIITQSVPDQTEFEYDMIDGMSVVVPNMGAIRRKLANTIGNG
jgi:anionic cell wall polymer biosynthesis LytR-Cps2A-Psr (LCP) family protein